MLQILFAINKEHTLGLFKFAAQTDIDIEVFDWS